MSELQLVLATFSYSEDEQEAFPYLKRYMTKVIPLLGESLREISTRNNFMLAGLFLTYRACNHLGCNISTDMGEISLLDIHMKRLELFRRVSGVHIESTRHYLELIDFKKHKSLFRGPGSMLLRFVASSVRRDRMSRPPRPRSKS